MSVGSKQLVMRATRGELWQFAKLGAILTASFCRDDHNSPSETFTKGLSGGTTSSKARAIARRAACSNLG